MRRLLLAAMVLAVSLTMSGVAAAQEPATLLLKSGERVSGELVDMGGSDFTVRVGGQDRRIKIGDVAVLEFGGDAQNLPASELNRVKAGQNVLVTKGGEVIEGKLYDVGGTRPLRISFTTSGQQRDLSSNDVARVYLAHPTAAAATSGSTPQAGENARTVQVSAARQWTPTGITVRQGEVVRFSSSGEVRLSANPDDVAQVAGKAGDYGVRATLPRTLLGALVGRIGNGEPFGIGDQASITMPASGQLYLGVNDADFRDNTGEFTVVLTPQSGAGGTRAIPRQR